jgi:carboxylesterase type B
MQPPASTTVAGFHTRSHQWATCDDASPVLSRPATNFSGQTINATNTAPASYQSLSLWSYLQPGSHNGSGFEATPQSESEDFLVLDVLVPASPVSNALPVVVHNPGGGYTEGNGAESYPGDAMVNASNGQLIYVSIQYRRCWFGLFGGSDIAQNGALGAGLLDQRAAPECVQRNTRAFGGDPSKATIWGGSAGVGSVTYQLIAGGAYDDPPISAAIAEYPWRQPFLNASTQERQYYRALQLSKCIDLNCLRSFPSETLANLNQANQNASYPGPGAGYGVIWCGPVVDGTFIRNLPDQEFKTGNFL